MTEDESGQGPGRRAVDGAKGVIRTTLTFQPEEKDFLLAELGGSAWVRKRIKEWMSGDGQAASWLLAHAISATTTSAKGRVKIEIIVGPAGVDGAIHAAIEEAARLVD